MGSNSLPYVWATVFAFRKTEKSKMYFDLIGRIQRNYAYYCALFNVDSRNYRNDYAFAIADTILNGYAIETKSIPGSILAVDQSIQSMTVKDKHIVVKDKNKSYVLPHTNLHVMSKAYLQSDDFKILVDRLINEP
jgi:hypothetical protein